MEKIIQDIFTFLYNLITDKDFYIPVLAVITAWILSFIPQRKQNIQSSIFELMKNQMNLLNRIEIQKYKGASFFIYAKSTLKRLYDFVSKEINDVPENQAVYYSNPLNKEVLEFSDTLLGRESLKIFYRNKPVMSKNEIEKDFERKKAEYVYEFFFETHYIFVGHYFRHLYNIIKFIDKQNRFWTKKKFYTGLIQAQMSAPELYVLFYNGLKFEKMEEFINKYSLIENLAKKDLMKYSHHKFYTCKMKDRTELPELKDLDFLFDKVVIKKEFEEELNYEFDHLEKLKKGISIKVGNSFREGLVCFDYLKGKLEQYYKFLISNEEHGKIRSELMNDGYKYGEANKIINESPAQRTNTEIDSSSLSEFSKYIFKIVYTRYNGCLDQYYNQALNILKYFERKENYVKKFDSDIIEYIDLFNTKLSSIEKFLLFYGGLYFPEMKEYLEKYNLFTGLTLEDLIDDKHQRFYKWELILRK